MSNLVIDLRLKGDFIDSFIYMGVLYLVDFNFKVNVYNWNEICDYIKERNGFKNKEIAKRQLSFIKSPYNNLSNKYEHIDTELSEIELLDHSLSSFDLGNYPSDISIFSNKFHYSCENGVFSAPLRKINTNITSIDTEKKRKIFDLSCFSISPNIGGRIAMAAGVDGVHTCSIENQNTKNNFFPEKQVSNGNCIDIDWLNNYLLVNNLDNNVIVNKYEKKIKDKEQFIKNKDDILSRLSEFNYTDLDDFNSVKCISDLTDYKFREISTRMLYLAPKMINLSKKYNYSWSSGDYNFLCDNEGIVDIFRDGQIIKTENFIKERKINISKIRTSGCGTFLEDDNKLMTFKDGNLDMLDDDIVRWRVFPRAKTHAGHLHIVKEDHLNIKVFNNKREGDFFSSYLSNHSNN